METVTCYQSKSWRNSYPLSPSNLFSHPIFHSPLAVVNCISTSTVVDRISTGQCRSHLTPPPAVGFISPPSPASNHNRVSGNVPSPIATTPLPHFFQQLHYHPSYCNFADLLLLNPLRKLIQ
ncbi:unnamed protein product [Amaranthus hypochondriacus]